MQGVLQVHDLIGNMYAATMGGLCVCVGGGGGGSILWRDLMGSALPLKSRTGPVLKLNPVTNCLE